MTINHTYMKSILTNAKHISLLSAFCGLFLLGACGGERNETDYENEIEAAENEIGDPMLKDAELVKDEADSLSDQPARIDGQAGHPAPPTNYPEVDENID